MKCPGTADGKHDDVIASLPGDDPVVFRCNACGSLDTENIAESPWAAEAFA